MSTTESKIIALFEEFTKRAHPALSAAHEAGMATAQYIYSAHGGDDVKVARDAAQGLDRTTNVAMWTAFYTLRDEVLALAGAERIARRAGMRIDALGQWRCPACRCSVPVTHVVNSDDCTESATERHDSITADE